MFIARSSAASCCSGLKGRAPEMPQKWFVKVLCVCNTVTVKVYVSSATCSIKVV